MSESRYDERWRSRGGRRRPRKSEGDPTPIRGLVGAILKKLGVAEQVERAAVFSEWEDRVGEKIAERARPVRLNEGTLFVEVESSSWMMELQMMKRELMERLNAGRESGRIEKLVFVQGGGADRPDDGRRSDDLVGNCDPNVTEHGASLSFVGPQEAIRETVAEYEEVGMAPDLRKIGSYDGSDRPLDSLTDRQQEVIENAFDLGYYEVPREASTEVVAAELNLDPSTVAEHLQRAERNLLRGQLSSES